MTFLDCRWGGSTFGQNRRNRPHRWAGQHHRRDYAIGEPNTASRSRFDRRRSVKSAGQNTRSHSEHRHTSQVKLSHLQPQHIKRNFFFNFKLSRFPALIWQQCFSLILSISLFANHNWKIKTFLLHYHHYVTFND